MRTVPFGMLAAVGFLLLAGCSDAPAPAEQTNSSSSRDSGRDSDDDDDDDDKNVDGDDQNDENNDLKLSGKSVFEFSVQTAFENQCRTCHADPRIQTDTRGPLTIYNYMYMKPLLEDGSSVDNALLRKMLGVDHTGGNQCPEGVGKPPCSYVVDWYKAEFGDDGAEPQFVEDTANTDARAHHISDVTSLGKVFGWSVDKGDLERAITVKLYADGEAGSGTLVDTATADRTGYDGNHSGSHQFMVDLPDSLRDGKQHTLYLYANISGTDELVAGPVSFTAYNYSQAGRDYYNSTILPLVARCKQCHSTTYEGHFDNLLSPSPAKGGTANSNELINKASGQGHGGGNRCGNGSPCNEFRTWWNLEFGE